MAAQQGNKGIRLFGRVVHAAEHAVFDGDEVARGALQIGAAGDHQLVDGMFAVERHERVAQRIVRRVQRQRERHGAVARQPLHHAHHAGGGHRHAPPRHAPAVVIQHDAQRGQHAVVVLQRLAHAHHHHVADDALARAKALAQEVLGKPELPQDFGGCQVAAEPLVPGGAEAAAHSAARLRGHAQRAPVIFGDVDRLHRVAIAHVKQPLDGAVRGLVLRDDRRRSNDGAPGELVAQRARQVAHGGEIALAPLVYPAEQLHGAEALFAQRLAPGGKCLLVKVKQVDGRIVHDSAAACVRRRKKEQF